MIEGSDKCDYSCIYLFCHIVGDLLTDVLFVVILYFENEIELFLVATFFLCISFVGSLPLAICIIEGEWRHGMQFKDNMRKYLSKYDKIVYMLSLLGGFYSAVAVCKSKLFYVDMFHIPMKKSTYQWLQQCKFVNIVIFEVCLRAFLLCC